MGFINGVKGSVEITGTAKKMRNTTMRRRKGRGKRVNEQQQRERGEREREMGY